MVSLHKVHARNVLYIRVHLLKMLPGFLEIWYEGVGGPRVC
jgi:hypothetical protein